MRKADFYLLLSLVSAMLVGGLIGLMWGSSSSLGILPRTASGLVGIPIAPFLHGGVFHLIGNLIYLLPLAWLVAWTGKGNLLKATLIIVFVGGLLTWGLGRSAYHIGLAVWYSGFGDF